MEKNKVLIAIDEPKTAEYIVSSLLNFVDKNKTKLFLLNVLELSPEREMLFLEKPELFIKHESRLSDYSDIENILTSQGIEYEFMAKEGNAADKILEVSTELKVDLLALGSHNRKGLELFFMGSVANKVVRHSKVSVIVIKHKLKLSDKTKALYAVDSEEFSRCISKSLPKFLDSNKVSISLLNIMPNPQDVIPPDAFAYTDIEKIIEESSIVSYNITENISKDLFGMGFVIEEKLNLKGDAASLIIEESQKGSFDLIVLGSHGKSGISRWLLGSVSTKVFEHAACSVLVVKNNLCKPSY